MNFDNSDQPTPVGFDKSVGVEKNVDESVVGNIVENATENSNGNISENVADNTVGHVGKTVIEDSVKGSVGSGVKSYEESCEDGNEDGNKGDKIDGVGENNNFSFKTVNKKNLKLLFMGALGVVTLLTVILGFDFDNTVAALKNANFWLLGVAFVFSLLPFYGSSLLLVAFTPEKLKLWDTIMMHVAGGIISLIAPAGFGIIALNVRFLNKHKINMSLSIATVFLTQVLQILTNVFFVVLAVMLGKNISGFSIPWFWVFVSIGVLFLLVVFLWVLPPFRRNVLPKISYYYYEVKPRFLWVLRNPRRLFIGWVGSVIMILGYATCFYFVLLSFSSHVSYVLTVLVFVAANQIGTSVPSPGGIGGVEVMLSGALVLVGVPTGVAFSVAVLFRVVSFWIRIPFGWFALTYCQKRNLL